MIHEIRKDITTVTEGIILHQVNAQGVMGSGVAKAIRDKWPVVFDRYMTLYNSYDSASKWRLMGQAQSVFINDNLTVYNLFGQYDINSAGVHSCKTEYGSLSAALRQLNVDVSFNPRYDGDEPNYIYLPYKMASDRGGADWNIVHNMVDTILSNELPQIINHITVCRL